MNKLLQIASGIAFVSMIFINYLSNTGKMNGTTIGEVSKDLQTLITPSGYAFSIWALIYLLLFGYIIYQGKNLFKVSKDQVVDTKISRWFLVSCIANSAWVFAWIYEYTLLSLASMFVLLLSLLSIMLRQQKTHASNSKAYYFFLKLPFAIYAGWITVASIVNVAALLVKLNWNGWGIDPVSWTYLLLAIALLINVYMTWKQRLPEFALVGAWAFVAIYYANINSEMNLAYTSLFMGLTMLLSSLVYLIKTMTSRLDNN